VLARLPDGTWLSRINAITVRIVEALVTVTCAGRHDLHRLLPAGHQPARPPPLPRGSPDGLYHERWESRPTTPCATRSWMGGAGAALG
jgi:hypothetical protein